MSDHPVLRRKEFDDLTMGWGSDSTDDLLARCELLSEWWQGNFPLLPAEHKIARAMIKSVQDRTGLELPTMQ